MLGTYCCIFLERPNQKYASDDEVPNGQPMASKQKASLAAKGKGFALKKRKWCKPVPPKPIATNAGD